jgi:transcriptional regulator NrdR family protein
MTRPTSAKRCRKCGRRGKVTDSRPVLRLGAQRRHHVCKCGHEWNTYECALELDTIVAAVEAVTHNGHGRVTVSISTPGRTVIRKP